MMDGSYRRQLRWSKSSLVMCGNYRRIFDYKKFDYNRRKAIIIDGRPDYKLCLGKVYSRYIYTCALQGVWYSRYIYTGALQGAWYSRYIYTGALQGAWYSRYIYAGVRFKVYGIVDI